MILRNNLIIYNIEDCRQAYEQLESFRLWYIVVKETFGSGKLSMSCATLKKKRGKRRKKEHREYGNGEFWFSKRGRSVKGSNLTLNVSWQRSRSLSKADDALISQSGERERLASPASRATTDVRRVDWCCKHSSSSALVVDYTGCQKSEFYQTEHLQIGFSYYRQPDIFGCFSLRPSRIKRTEVMSMGK